MIKLNIGSDNEFTELQLALERSLSHELQCIEEGDEPGVRLIVSGHLASIKIIKVLLNRLSDLESRKSFKKQRVTDENEQ
jgi:hypothetical protein